MILKLMIVEIKRYLRSLYYLVVLFILFLIHMLGLKGASCIIKSVDVEN